MLKIAGLFLLGAAAGVLSGLMGIGGGLIIVPALVYLFGYGMHTAQGTSLAVLVPPIGILAMWSYYQKGDVNVIAAVAIAVGFIISSVFGAKIALALPEATLRKTFAVLLAVVAVRMFFQGSGKGV